jgi:quaternary ammonium compound-resistance protein SugE
MMWIVLAASGVLEAVWASVLPATKGFKKPLPTAVVAAAAVLSLVGLSFAMTEIPTGTAYSVWVAIGAVLTLAYSVCRGKTRTGRY